MADIEEIQEALCDVRKAHRIIYAYQKRMMDIARFIGKKLDFVSVEGYKHFSNGAPKKITSATWAWDFIYSYLFEYYLGEKELQGRNCEYAMSLFQYSDTGFFDSERSTRTNIASFAPEEESVSKFLFLLEVKPKGSGWWWNIAEVINKKEYASRHHSATILKEGENTVVLYSVPIERFIDERSGLEVLKEFCDFCEKENVIQLTLH